MSRMLLMVVAVVVCAGCRSDGGFGREDASRGRAYSAGTFAEQTRIDSKRTWDLLASVEPALIRSFGESKRQIVSTYEMYIDNHATR